MLDSILSLINYCKPVNSLDSDFRVFAFDVLFALLSLPGKPVRAQCIDIWLLLFLGELVPRSLSGFVIGLDLHGAFHVQLVNLLALEGPGELWTDVVVFFMFLFFNNDRFGCRFFDRLL